MHGHACVRACVRTYSMKYAETDFKYIGALYKFAIEPWDCCLPMQRKQASSLSFKSRKTSKEKKNLVLTERICRLYLVLTVLVHL